MPFIVRVSSLSSVQGFCLTNVIPDRMRPLNPFLIGDIWQYRYCILTWLPKHKDIISKAWTHPGCIFSQLHKQQAFRMCSNSLHLRIFINRDLTVINPPTLTKSLDGISPEVFHADIAMCCKR